MKFIFFKMSINFITRLRHNSLVLCETILSRVRVTEYVRNVRVQ